MDAAESKRMTLIGYARIFGVDIQSDDATLEASVDDLIGFIADLDLLSLDGVTPAADYDPVWPRVNESSS